MFGQIQTGLNFYFYGRKHFTQTGYLYNSSRYATPAFHETASLSNKVVMITGSNAGIGKELALYAAKKDARVFMLCRTPSRAEDARKEIVAESGNENIHVLQCDVSLEADVRRAMKDFESHESFNGKVPELHALVTNAGALLNDRTLTKEGVENTFAAHLLYGTYLLGRLAMPTMEKTRDSRIIMVSSGGMYNTKLPGWEHMASTHENSEKGYSGNLAYAYAKRGQVILAERWAQNFPNVKVVSCHPGWTLTDGVEAAYGSQKSYLEPMRSKWEGAEGIAWLVSVDSAQIESGGFYLDRQPQPKHIAGSFFYEGSATKNSTEEIDMFMENLERVTMSSSLSDVWQNIVKGSSNKLAARANPAVGTEKAVDIPRFMRNWSVLAAQPIEVVSEHLTSNGLEQYNWDSKRELVEVKFNSSPLDKPVSETQQSRMHGIIKNAPNSHWSLNIKFGIYLPTALDYVLMHIAEDFSWCLVGLPSRANMWIMTTKRPQNKKPRPMPSNIEYRETAAANSEPVTTSKDVLTTKEEDEILREGLKMAENLGFDISMVRIACWR